MFKGIVNYVKEDDFSIKIWNNKINIVNFKDIVILEDTKVVILSPDGKVVIRGNNLSINKLLDNELLITGIIISIELGDYYVQ